MKLAQLLASEKDIGDLPSLEVNGIALSSVAISQGDVFFAYPGERADGRDFIKDAVDRGAVAIVVESVIVSPVRTQQPPADAQSPVPIIPIENLAQKVGSIASNFYGHPSHAMKVIAITGTNGKTSCAWFIAQALTKLGVKTAMMGTLGCGFLNDLNDNALTTPDAISVQKNLAMFKEQGAQVVVLEASSHSLAQGRLNSVDVDVAVFTNLTRDHLDYHGTMAEYGKAKKRLFSDFKVKHFVINIDDDFGANIAKDIKKALTYSLKLTTASLFADDISLTKSGLMARIVTKSGQLSISASIIGSINIENILAVVAVLQIFDMSNEQIVSSLQSLSCVPGRLEAFPAKNGALFVVDYAHTPDALNKSLSTLKMLCQGKLVCVFGCGGDRDKGKRPLMARAAAKYADTVIVTSDNPRTEDPQRIIGDIAGGFFDKDTYKVIVDRRRAIEEALSMAGMEDVVIIAGKGHEDCQIIGDEKFSFSDVEIVKAFIGAKD